MNSNLSFRGVAPALGLVLLAVSIITSASPAIATFQYADLVAERNLATEGRGTETFAYGADRINRFNGALAYSASLGDRYPVGSRLSYSLGLEHSSSLWRFDTSGGTVTAVLDERFDAGAGWGLSFGELHAPSTAINPSQFWVYRSSKGTISRFYQTLEDGDPVVFNTFYTRDGSYLRLTVNGTEAVVASTDGVERVFDQQTGGDWLFGEQRDNFGNSLTVTYTATERQITDSHGRSHKIVLQADPSGSGGQVIDRVELAAFGGTVAVYDLTYTTATIDLPSQDTDPATPAQQTVALLSSVSYPDGQVMTFAYHSTAGSVPHSGRLATVGLTTGGFLDYTYQVVELPKVNGALHTADVVGVSHRVARWPVGGPKAIYGAWQFDMSLDRDRDTPTNLKPRELTTRVTYPDGFYRDYKHSAFAGGDPANDHSPPINFFLRDYAFPFSKMLAVPGDTYFDHELVYDAGGQLIRTERIRYQSGPCAGCWDQHPQQSGTMKVYQDGSGLTETEAFGSAAGLGRFGAVHSWDSTGTPATRTTIYTYAHGIPAATAPWVATGWTEKTVSQGTESKKVQRCVDSMTGLVTRKRTLIGSVPAAHDLVETYAHHASGNPSVTRFYGGDTQTLATGALCSLSLPSQEQYASYRNYQHGALSSEGWRDASGGVFLETYTATIDLNTGLVASRAGADGFTWTYNYDVSGRRILASPPIGHGGTEVTTYQPAVSGSSLATTTVVITAADGTTELNKNETQVDEFGRVTQGKRWTSAGWIAVTSTYDASGRLVQSTTPGGITKWLAFDPFGRATTVRPPEGASHDRTFAFSGRAITETVKIGKQWDPITNNVVEIDRSITTTRDRFGHRRQQHIADADGEQRTETYTVGLDGSIRTTVITDGTTTDTLTVADLTDNRGFQVQTATGSPITGYDAIGNRTTVDFGQGTVARVFDRAGRLLEESEGTVGGALWTQNVYASTSVGIDYKGGKLVSSLRVNRDVPHFTSGSVVYVEDLYAYTGDGGSLAELRTTVSTDTQTIVSFVTSRSVDNTGEVSSMTFPDCDPAYNDTFSLCTPRHVRTMTTESDYGELERFYGTVNGVNEPWIDGVVRDSAGRITETTLGNGLVETRTPHNSGRGRLERLTLFQAGSGTLYDSGNAQYDALGKLVKLGTQRRVSDNAYKLEIQQLPAPGTAPSAPPTPQVDYLGQLTRRSYSLPYRWDPTSAFKENVTEVLVYGPGNRRVWTRKFNDYQASTYRNSIDRWYLIDPSGRQVREADAITYYAGTTPQWSNAQINGVWFSIDLAEDDIYFEGGLIGRTDDRANSPARIFLHRDFFNRLFAESSASGTVEIINGALLH
ncbi:MAG: hypothetical protein AAGD38_08480 [Acidobacteriota bacterium]